MSLNIIIGQKKVGYNSCLEAFTELEENIDGLEKPERGSLLVLPELLLSGFNREKLKFFADQSEDVLKQLKSFAKRKDLLIATTIVERDPNTTSKFTNAFVLISPKGELLSRYLKMHLFPSTGESHLFTKGLTPTIVKFGDVLVGFAICYDLRFPGLFRYYARNGVNLVLVASCFPDPKENDWRILLQARAVENQYFVIGVNASGQDRIEEQTLTYFGHSRIVDPKGHTILHLDREESLVSRIIDLEEVVKCRDKIHFIKDDCHEFV